MKKLIFTSILISGALILSNCSKKDDSGSPITNGTYNATGTVTFKAGAVNYSLPITTVNVTSSSLTINALNTSVTDYGSLILVAVSLNGIGIDIYEATYGSTITFIDRGLTNYLASVLTSGSSCSINITKFSSATIKGTFTATVVPTISGTGTVNITNGVINCTLTTKKTK
jgi:hypothetical protein